MLEDRIKQCLKRFPEIKLAFLFGSQATGKANAKSDVDIALAALKKIPLRKK